MPDTSPTHPETRAIPALAPVQQHLVSPAAPVVAKVVSSRICTADRKAAGFVRHVEIDVSGTPLEGAWRAGQSFGVVPPGTDEKGRPHKLRLYSIASATKGETGDATVLATTVKRTIDEDWDSHKLFLGVCSNYLCDLQEGDELLVTGPVGKRFVLPEDPHAHDYVFFATGTGIAPFRGMLGDLESSNYHGHASLVMGTPYRTDLLYDPELRTMEAQNDWFRYRTAISRETTENQHRPMYVQDRLEADAEELIEVLSSDRALIYVCGIAGMELGILRSLWTMLPPTVRTQYLNISPDVPADPAQWDRKMIPRLIKPTKRVMLEVY